MKQTFTYIHALDSGKFYTATIFKRRPVPTEDRPTTGAENMASRTWNISAGDRPTYTTCVGMMISLLISLKAGVVCLQVKLCDPRLSALEMRFSRRGATQIYVYLYLYPTSYCR